jgi:hypothetical protein
MQHAGSKHFIPGKPIMQYRGISIALAVFVLILSVISTTALAKDTDAENPESKPVD